MTGRQHLMSEVWRRADERNATTKVVVALPTRVVRLIAAGRAGFIDTNHTSKAR